MPNFTVKIFPLAAVLVSIIACKWPQLFTPGKPLVEPLLGVIMLGMRTTLSIRDFQSAAKRPLAVLIGMSHHFYKFPPRGSRLWAFVF